MAAEIVEMLERKIEQLIAHCQDLAVKNAGLKAELSEKEREVMELKGQLNSLMEERQEVSGRIERLIAKIEEAAGEAPVEDRSQESSDAGYSEGSEGASVPEDNTIQFPHS